MVVHDFNLCSTNSFRVVWSWYQRFYFLAATELGKIGQLRMLGLLSTNLLELIMREHCQNKLMSLAFLFVSSRKSPKLAL